MKPKTILRTFLIFASTSCFAITTASAATLYWDGATPEGAPNGGTGTWNTSTGSWDSVISADSSTAWSNTALDTAVLLNTGVASTVTLDSPIIVGGLMLRSTSTSNGYTIAASDTNTLTFGATNNTVSLLNGTNTSLAAATISGAVTGTGNLFFTSINPVVASTLTLSGTSAAGWLGSTTINPNFTLTLTGDNQSLKSTSGVNLNGGNIILTNTSATAITNDRISSNSITSNGGTIRINNTSGTGVYAESIGTVALTSGQTNLFFGTNAAGTGSQTLTLGDLTRTGTANTSSVNFSSASFLNATKNMMFVSGKSATTAGEIIGAWATTGSSTSGANDYAVYSTGEQVLPANISATTEDTWTTTSNAYTSSATSSTLTATRTAAALRNTGATATLDLASGANLETFGILNGASTVFTVAPGTGGTLSTPSGGGQLHLNAGTGPLTISAPIIDNAGAVTLVKNGSDILTLSSTSNTYTGNTVLNAGTLIIGAVSNIGGAGATLSINGNASFTPSAEVNFSTGTLNVGQGALATLTTRSMTFATTTGAGTIAFGNAGNITLALGNASGFTGGLRMITSNSTQRNISFTHLGDSAGAGNLMTGGGTPDSERPDAFILTGNASAVTFNHRAIELQPRIASNHATRFLILENNNSSTSNTWIINTDLVNNIEKSNATLQLSGSNAGANAFNGKLVNSSYNQPLLIQKQGTSRWIIGGDNSYSGTTTISAGSLVATHANSLGAITSGTSVANGSALLLRGGISFAAEPLSLGAGSSPITILRNDTGNNTWNGPITMTGSGSSFVARIESITDLLTLAGDMTGTASSNNYVLQGNGDINVTGKITGASGLISSSTGTGIRTLTHSANDYTGTTLIAGGTLQLGNGGTTGSLTGTSVINSTGTTSALVINRSNAFNQLADLNNKVIAGTASLTQAGSGTTTLSLVNTYAGATNVNAGKLFINGSTSATSEVNVASGATLGGNGMIGHNVTIANMGKLEFDLSTAAASHDKLELDAAKTVTFSGASTLTLTSTSGASAGDYTLLTAPGGFGASVAPATVVLPAGWTADAPRFDGNDLKINITSTGSADPYLAWAGAAPFDGDVNADGVSNGLAFMLGAASPSVNAVGLLPTVTQASGGLVMNFSMLNAAGRGTATMDAQHSSDLGLTDAWTSVAVPDVSGTSGGLTFVVTPGSPTNTVQITIPSTEAAAGKLFGRLRTVKP